MPPTEHDLEVVVGRLLEAGAMTLAIAESCTGGLVGHLITDVPGSSAYYRGGITAYANDLKESLLGVEQETLTQHGAVSEQTAREMAQGVRQALQADLGISVTGIAGPSGGTEEKPVGLVYVALAATDEIRVDRCVFEGDRWENKARSAQMALDLVRSYLEERV
jgi:PncC family amidohydrolase